MHDDKSWVRERVRVTGKSGVLGDKDNGKKTCEICASVYISTAKTYFQHKIVSKYTGIGT